MTANTRTRQADVSLGYVLTPAQRLTTVNQLLLKPLDGDGFLK